MPYVVRWVDYPHIWYMGKHGYESTVDSLKKARIFPNLGAIKNSLAHDDANTIVADTEIVELELVETGKVLLAQDLIVRVLEKREEKETKRRAKEAVLKKKRELETLKKLKERYDK